MASDEVRENFEARARRFGNLASACHSGRNIGLGGAVDSEPPLATVSLQGVPDHHEFVPEASSMEERTKKTPEECKKLELKLSEAKKGKKKEKKKDKEYAQLVTKVEKLVSDLEEEKELNKCLQENQKLLQEKLKQTEEKLLQAEAARKQEVSDLQEQLADLMRHLETQQAIACAPDETRQELQDGQIVMGEGSSSKHQSKKTRRKTKT